MKSRAISVPLLLALICWPSAAYGQSRGEIYLSGGATVDVYRADDFTLLAQIPVAASRLAVAPDGRSVYATVGGDVARLDTGTRTVLATVPVCTSPWGIDVAPDGSVLVACYWDQEVAQAAADLSSVTARYPVDGFPRLLRAAGDSRVYVGGDFLLDEDDLPSSGLAMITPDSGLVQYSDWTTFLAVEDITGHGVAITPGGNTLYVASNGLDSVIEFETGVGLPILKRVISVSSGGSPLNLLTDPSGTSLYVSFSASIIDGATVGIIEVATGSFDPVVIEPDDPWGLDNFALSGDGAELFAVNGPVVRVMDTVTRAVAREAPVANNGDIALVAAPVSIEDLVDSAIATVVALVDDGVLSRGQGNALAGKLEGALAKLNAGKSRPAINTLNAFVNQVTGMIADGTLTPAEGQPLIDAALAIIEQIENGG